MTSNGIFSWSRRLAGPLAGLALAGCAHMEPPSGGPVDTTPPAVAAVYPPPGARNVRADAPVVFQFSEWIDRDAARSQVFVSPPLRGKLSVTAEGDKLQVKPSEASGGFRPNTAYQVTVLPGLKDLHGVTMGRAFSLRFSTGSSVDVGSLTGAVEARGPGVLMAALYRVDDRSAAEAASLRDTGRPGALPEPWRELPAHLAAADSLGVFAFDSVAQGDYALLAFQDVNNNFAFDMGFERGAVGPLRLALRPRPEADVRLRTVALDTFPLAPRDVRFVAAAPADSLGRVPGKVLLEFNRPPQPRLAAEPARYRLFSDSGEVVPVAGAAWDPMAAAWVLETEPLRAGRVYRLVTTGRPDFGSRGDPARQDTSVAFEVAGAADSSAWKLVFVAPAASTGLPQAVSTVPAATEIRVAGNRLLTPERVRSLQARLEARLDTAVLAAQVSRVNPVTFSLSFSRALEPGRTLRLRLRPDATDSAGAELLTGKVADSVETGRVFFSPPEPWRGWTFWLQGPDDNAPEFPFVAEAGMVSARAVPPGRYALYAFRDEDGDGAWDPGAVRPWKAQEPFARALDSVRVDAGASLDLTSRLAP